MKPFLTNFSKGLIVAGFLIGILLLPSNIFRTAAAAQENDPYKIAAAQPPSMADYPLAFEVVSQRKMINGAYQYAGWTPVIRGRMLGRARKGDAVIVDLAQDGKLIHTLCALD